jgi:hypothetical protein
MLFHQLHCSLIYLTFDMFFEEKFTTDKIDDTVKIFKKIEWIWYQLSMP